MTLPATKPVDQWTPTKYSNIRRYHNGKYYARAKVHGRLVRKCLRTKSLEVAKMKLDRLLEGERKRLAKKPEGALTVADLIAEYLSETERNDDLKDSTKLYKRDTIKMIRLLWPGLDESTAPTERQCQEWAAKARKAYSASRFNSQLETLRAVLQVGVTLGVIADNPLRIANKKRGVTGIARAKQTPKPVVLPSKDGFASLLKALHCGAKVTVPDHQRVSPKGTQYHVPGWVSFQPAKSRRRASIVVRLLAFSGLRIGAARKLLPSHVNLEGNYLEKPPLKFTDTVKRLPLFPDLRKVLVDLIADHPGTGPLLPIKNPRKALRNACRDAGIPPLTNHQLRHLFATRCLESRIDIKTVAEWLDHVDGGALLLKRYAHLIDDHSQRMSKRVKF